MPGLQMKYFVLKPKGDKDDPYARASRKGLLAYAEEIETVDHDLYLDLVKWVVDIGHEE